MKKKINYCYFGGSGFCNIFYLGFVKFLREYYDQEYINTIIFHGDSAGSLIALMCVLNIDSEYYLNIYSKLNLSIDPKFFKYHEYIESFLFLLIKHIDKDEILKKINSRYRIGLTNFPNKYIIKEKWNSIDELLKDILSTTYIPLLSNNNSKYIDGSFTFKRKYIKYSNVVTIGINNKLNNSYNIGYFVSDKKVINKLSFEEIYKFIKIYYYKSFEFFKIKDNKVIEVKRDYKNSIINNISWILLVLLKPFSVNNV